MNIGKETLEKLEILSKISNGDKGVTRFYLTKEYIEARNLIEKWMIETGLTTHIDAVGNLVGEYNEGAEKTLVMGSHQDSVKEGGAFDGIMGVILPLVCIKNILKEKGKLGCNMKIISFAYEEGLTFKNACMTSKAVAGVFNRELLELVDENGRKLKNAMIEYGLNPEKIEDCKLKDVDAFLEVHIEQGPVLVYEDKAVGIVTAIQSCNRYILNIKGEAGHSGTIPMKLRKDAGRAMAEIICRSSNMVEEIGGIVLTFGKVDIKPGAVNIVPGEAEAVIDIRAMENRILVETMEKIEKLIEEVTGARGMNYSLVKINELMETVCSPNIVSALEKSFERVGVPVFKLTSGAGHDTQEMEKLTAAGMLFVRCRDGISHNPAEYTSPEDMDIAGQILTDFIENF